MKAEELNDIVEIPHGKQSRYAQVVLELWLSKDPSQATKAKLIQALEATGLRKALGTTICAISYIIYVFGNSFYISYIGMDPTYI